MIDRRNKHRDTRDGAWLRWGHQVVVAPRRSRERLREDYWRMRAGFIETW